MPVAERLAGLVNSATVQLESLGTTAELAAEAADLAAGPFAPVLAAAFCAEHRSGKWSTEVGSAFLGFVSGLDKQRSYLALRDVADILLDDEKTLVAVGSAIHNALLPDAETIDRNPLLAGLRLDIALEVVVRTTIPPYQVLGVLTRPVSDQPEDFDQPLARALGVASDFWTTSAEQARFAVTLGELAARGCEDAAYELAVSRLRLALGSQRKDGVLEGIRVAQAEFDALTRSSEGRDDASAFAQACAALIAFDQADRSALESAAGKARALANRRSLLELGMHDRGRATAGQIAEMAWASLAWRLETAAVELEEDAFLDTWVAVDAIIQVYEADRQFANLGTINALVRPRIVNVLARREAMAHQLERAVAIDRKLSETSLPPEIYELLDLVHRARAAGRESADDPEEPSPSDTHLRALLGPAAHLLSELQVDDRKRLEAAAHQTFIGTLDADRPTNDYIDQLVARLVADLTQNDAFTGKAKSNFSLLILFTVRFLVHVNDFAQPYTRPISAGAVAPLEVELQKHFHQFLSATELAGRVGMEHANIAGGRADVITTFDGAQRFVTEVKRELGNASREALQASYLAQTLEYQSTNEPLGQLLVLDLTSHSSGTPNLKDSIWITHQRDQSGRVTASAVVAVVRGNRPSPSGMS